MRFGKRKLLGLASLAGFVGSVIGANYAVNRFGFVPVGFGLMAPAGVYVVGLAFALRDATQRLLGKTATVSAIGAGAALSALVSPALAVASGTAFAVSELSDFAVYTPLRRRFAIGAVIASGIVGAAVDSALFLQLAFGNWHAYFLGNFTGKVMMTLAAAAVLFGVRYGRRLLRRG